MATPVSLLSMLRAVPLTLRGVPPPPSCPLLPLVLRPASLVSSRSALRLPRAGDAAPARARGARALGGAGGGGEGGGGGSGGVGVVVVSGGGGGGVVGSSGGGGGGGGGGGSGGGGGGGGGGGSGGGGNGSGPGRISAQRSGSGGGSGESALSGTTSARALHTFTLDSGASRSFFRDRTTLTPLSRPVAVSLADPSGGPVLARFSIVLPCPAVPSGTLSGLYSPCSLRT
ncbi:unnamed protein product, partial [Closterium sp. NIES-64]